jgi:hypothetical protein
MSPLHSLLILLSIADRHPLLHPRWTERRRLSVSSSLPPPPRRCPHRSGAPCPHQSAPRHPRVRGLTYARPTPRACPRQPEGRCLSASSSSPPPAAPRHPCAASPHPRLQHRRRHPRPLERRAEEEKEGGTATTSPFSIIEPLPESEITLHSSTPAQQLATAPPSYPPQDPRWATSPAPNLHEDLVLKFYQREGPKCKPIDSDE